MPFPFHFNTDIKYGISNIQTNLEEMELNGQNQATIYSPIDNTINVIKIV